MVDAILEWSKTHAKLYALLWAAATVIFIILSSLAVAALARWVVKLRGNNKLYQQRAFAGYFFASPWIVGFVIFVLGPTLASLYWSLTRFELPNPPVWVALENYVRMITRDETFRVSLLNSLYMTVVGMPLQLIAALAVAMMLYQRPRGDRIFRLIYYVPVMLATSTAMLMAWRLVLNPNNGMLNTAIRGLGDIFPPFEWLTRAGVYVIEILGALFMGLQRGSFNTLQNVLRQGFPGPDVIPLWHQDQLWSKPAVVLIQMWSSGAMMLIYLASLYNMPADLLEAAQVDGANAWQRFRHIILPLISPATFYNLIIGMIATLQLFEASYVLVDNGGPAESTYFLAYYLYRSTFRFNKIGYGAAMSWILMVIVLVLTLIQFRVSKRWVHYG